MHKQNKKILLIIAFAFFAFFSAYNVYAETACYKETLGDEGKCIGYDMVSYSLIFCNSDSGVEKYYDPKADLSTAFQDLNKLSKCGDFCSYFIVGSLQNIFYNFSDAIKGYKDISEFPGALYSCSNEVTSTSIDYYITADANCTNTKSEGSDFDGKDIKDPNSSDEDIKESNSSINLDGTKPTDANKDALCKSILGDSDDQNYPAYWIQFFLKIMRFAAIIALIIMSTLDFIKAVAAQDGDALKKATNTVVKRVIYAVIIFFVPNILDIILTFLGIYCPTSYV